MHEAEAMTQDGDPLGLHCVRRVIRRGREGGKLTRQSLHAIEYLAHSCIGTAVGHCVKDKPDSLLQGLGGWRLGGWVLG